MAVDALQPVADVLNQSSEVSKKSKKVDRSAADTFLVLQDFTAEALQGLLSLGTVF